jgi:hypothetical protein
MQPPIELNVVPEKVRWIIKRIAVYEGRTSAAALQIKIVLKTIISASG